MYEKLGIKNSPNPDPYCQQAQQVSNPEQCKKLKLKNVDSCAGGGYDPS